MLGAVIGDIVGSRFAWHNIDFTLDEIRDAYRFNEACQDTVPQALEAFFESARFQDAIRGAIFITGDSDTLAAITGGIDEAYYVCRRSSPRRRGRIWTKTSGRAWTDSMRSQKASHNYDKQG